MNDRETTLPISPETTIVCTIVSKNYLAAARALMASIREHHDDLHLVTLLVDEIDDHFEPEGEPFHVILARDLGIPNWSHFSMKYDIMELNTAVKPYFLEVLFERHNARNVIYFDPDIIVYHRLDELLELLDEHNSILIPHITQPLNDEFSPGELDFLRIGTYNLGFFAISRKGPWRELLRWWQKKVYNDCTREVERGLFVDQHWMDLVPSLFEGAYVLRKPGYNLAYWNFKLHDLQQNSHGGYVVDGEPLIFFHFSGYSINNMEIVSKHQNRFTLPDLNEHYRACFEDYARRLREYGHDAVCEWPYAYSRFADGAPVTDILRITLREHDLQGKTWPDPFDLTTPDNFRKFATAPNQNGLVQFLSPYMLTLYRLRPDLQQAFPKITDTHQADFAHWFVDYEGSGPTFHAAYTGPVKERLEQAIRQMKSAGRTDTTAKREGTGAGHINASGRAANARVRPARISLKRRLGATLEYYREFPATVAPYIPKGVLDTVPEVYTGPGGLYGRIRHSLQRMGILKSVRKLIGLRLIMTARYYFTFPLAELQLLHMSNGASAASKLFPNGDAAALSEPQPAVALESNDHTPARDPAQQATPAVMTAQPALSQRSQGANIIGWLYSETGVGQAARNVLKALNTVEYPTAVLPVEQYDTSRKSDRMADEFVKGVPHFVNVFHVNADMTYPIHNLLGKDAYNGHHNIGFWFWEIANFPEQWQDCFDVYDEIWVGSSFVQSTIAARSTKPVVHQPLAIEVALPENVGRSDLGLPEARFLFLYMFDARSIIERKNPLAVIEAFEKAFTSAERQNDVRLVLKATNLGSFSEEAQRLEARMDDVNGILIDRYLSRAEVNALVDQCDAYVSLHRSEGYGLTIAEAMYLRKPVVATAYSGNVDFMTPDNSCLVPYRLVELERDYGPYTAGSVWADPDIEAAAEMMRHLYDNPIEAQLRGDRAGEHIRSNYTPQVVGRHIASRLELILNRHRV